MTDRYAYLAGPITGTGYEDARNGWRRDLAALLPSNIWVLSPMRGTDELHGSAQISDNYQGLLSANVTIERDFDDIRRSDVVVVHLLGASRVSIGTMIELGMAYTLGKPVVTVVDVEDEACPHHHAWVFALSTYVAADLAQAADAVKFLTSTGL